MSENISINECNNKIRNSDSLSFIKSITRDYINNNIPIIPKAKKKKIDKTTSSGQQTETQIQSEEYRKDYNRDDNIQRVNDKLSEFLQHLNDNNIDPNTISDEYMNELLCGFFDGDGCLFVDKNGYIRIIFYQSRTHGHPPELIFIKKYIIKRLRADGIISADEEKSTCSIYTSRADNIDDPDAVDDRYINDNEHTNKTRPGHALRFGKRRIVSYILNNILVKLALKQPQRQLALQHLNNIETINRSENKAAIIETFYKNMSRRWGLKALAEYQKVTINPDYVTDAYITGFFIAEGCIYISFYSYKVRPSLFITYTQLQSSQLLVYIGMKLNINVTLNSGNDGYLVLFDTDALAAIVVMWPFLSAIVPISAKGEQVKIMLEHHKVYLELRMTTINYLNTEQCKQLSQQLRDAITVITDLKHQ